MLNHGNFSLDIEDLTRSIALAAVVLDRSLHVRLMTPAAAHLLRVDASAVGSNVADVPGLMAQAHLIGDARSVLDGEVVERLVLCPTGDCAMRRSQPYLSQGRGVEGVVITLTKRDDRARHDAAPETGRVSCGSVSDLASEQVLSKLTARQREIMCLVLAGHPSKRIAAELGISSRTVENHRASIMHRTGCRSLPELTRFALRATPAEAWS